jgi:ferritin-like metal-binding protein YciE
MAQDASRLSAVWSHARLARLIRKRTIIMGMFTSKKFDSMDTLLLDQLRDLYDAEHRLTDALPKMARAAKSPELKSAFESHLRETEGHIKRLDQAFASLDEAAKRETCDAMKGLIEEGEDVLEAKGDDDVIDAALIASAQRVEHYEMAGYGTARNFAERVGKPDVARLLQETLDEEGAADEKLTTIAQATVNPHAA